MYFKSEDEIKAQKGHIKGEIKISLETLVGIAKGDMEDLICERMGVPFMTGIDYHINRMAEEDDIMWLNVTGSLPKEYFAIMDGLEEAMINNDGPMMRKMTDEEIWPVRNGHMKAEFILTNDCTKMCGYFRYMHGGEMKHFVFEYGRFPNGNYGINISRVYHVKGIIRNNFKEERIYRCDFGDNGFAKEVVLSFITKDCAGMLSVH